MVRNSKQDQPVVGIRRVVTDIDRAGPVRLFPTTRAGSTSKSLWDKALLFLEKDDRSAIDIENINKRAVLDGVLEAVQSRIRMCEKRKWKYTSPSGKVVAVRDLFEKISFWVYKFREVGDAVIQYDPVHAALPWAGVRLVLQVIVNDTQTYGAMLSGVEYVSGIITRYATVESLYLRGNTEMHRQLSDAIIRLYAAILVYLSKASRYYDSSTLKRTLSAIVKPVETSVDKYLQGISLEEAKVEKIARLLDATLMQKMAISTQEGLKRIDHRMEDNHAALVKKLDSIQVGMKTMSSNPVSRMQALEWLGSVSTEEYYQKALKSKVDSTCEWLVQRPSFGSWLSSDQHKDMSKVLWVHGSPGFGKSVLCAHVISHLESSTILPIAYFFCIDEDEDKRKTDAIIRSWIAQLIEGDEMLLELLLAEVKSINNRQATEEMTWKIFGAILQQLPGCILVIDGFDECDKIDTTSRVPTSTGQSVFLTRLLKLLSGTGSKLLLVSRDHTEIRSGLFETDYEPTQMSVAEYEITEEDTKEDVSKVSSELIRGKLPKKSQELVSELATKVTEKSAGMFLWIYLLQSRLNPAKPAKQLQNIVQDTPPGLDFAYAREVRDIQNLDNDDRERAIAILRWAIFASRPLTVRELTEAVLVSTIGLESESFPADDLPDPLDLEYVNHEIKRLCGSLLTLRGGADDPIEKHTVHLVHFSVKEFLLKDTGISFQDPDTESRMLGHACIRYLLYDDFETSKHLNEEDMKLKLQNYQFLRYAAPSVIGHLRSGSIQDESIELLQKLFDPSSPRWMVWVDTIDFANVTNYSNWVPSNSPTYYASAHNIPEIFDHVLDSDSHINSKGGRWGSPLAVASANGQLTLVKKLLERGADMNARSINGSTALLGAAQEGHQDVLEYLIAHGANIRASNNERRTALHLAAMYGNAPAVSLLLDKGLDVNLRGLEDYTPLQYALTNNREDVAELLLERGADIEAQDIFGTTPLSIAISESNDRMATLLLDRGANPSIGDCRNVRPLHTAAALGSPAVIKQLVAAGADLNVPIFLGMTPLAFAATKGNEPHFDCLCDLGADVNATGGLGLTPLLMAASQGHLSIVKRLVDKGADLEHVSSDGGTPLWSAANYGYASVVEELARRGANLETRHSAGSSPLMAAIFKQEMATIKALVTAGADVHTLFSEPLGDVVFTDTTPLHFAATLGPKEAVELLLDAGCDVEALCGIKDTSDGTDLKEVTPLHCSTASKDHEIIALLLSRGAKIDSRVSDQSTMLHFAASDGTIPMIKLLLEAGLDIEAQDDKGQTPLMHATTEPNAETVKALIDAGAAVNTIDKSSSNPLDCAVTAGNEEIVAILIAAGADLEKPGKETSTPLIRAAIAAHLGVLKQLLEAGANIEGEDQHGYTSLVHAASSGQAEIVAALLDAGASKNPAALHWALSNKQDGVVKLLVEAKFALDVEHDGDTLLEHAARSGQDAIMELLITAGAPIDPPSKAHVSALDYAIQNNHASIVRQLLVAGADANRLSHWKTLLQDAIDRGFEDIARLLLQHRANVHATSSEGDWTALHFAALYGRRESVDILLASKADPNASNEHLQTPLHIAAQAGYLYICKVLIKSGANPGLKDIFGHSSFDWAQGDADVLAALQDGSGYPESSDEENAKRLSKGLDKIRSLLLTSMSKSPDLEFADISLRLAQLGDLDSARIALEQGSTLDEMRSCDGCSVCPIEGTVYRSKSCHDLDFCQSCMERYDKKELDIGMYRIPCRNLEFYEFRRIPKEELPPWIIDGDKTGRDEWLKSVAEKHGLSLSRD